MTVPTINEIQAQILSNADAADDLPVTEILTPDEQDTLGSITNTSRVSPYRAFIYVVAVVIWTAYKLVSVLSLDIDERIAISRPFTKGWYEKTALAYQHGQELLEAGIYDNTGLTIAQINERKIISKAAIIEGFQNGRGILRIKTAKLVNDELQPLEADELNGFAGYMELMGAAGVPVVPSSGSADDLKVHYKIYFDPTILNNLGQRIDGSNDTPVQNAIENYLKTKNSRDFNGELSMDQFNDVIEAVPGVIDVFKQNAWSKYSDFLYTDTNTQGNVGPISEYRQPDSGYFKLDLDTSIFEFLPR